MPELLKKPRKFVEIRPFPVDEIKRLVDKINIRACDIHETYNDPEDLVLHRLDLVVFENKTGKAYVDLVLSISPFQSGGGAQTIRITDKVMVQVADDAALLWYASATQTSGTSVGPNGPPDGPSIDID